MTDYRQLASHSLAWMVVLFPVGLFLVLWLIPHALGILGWVCEMMRAFAEAVKG